MMMALECGKVSLQTLCTSCKQKTDCFIKKCHGTAAGPNISTNPSKHARSDLRPVQSGWEALARQAGWVLHTSLLLDQICLAKSWHNQPELNWIWAGFAYIYILYYPGHLSKNTTESQKWETSSGPVVSCQKPSPMIPAHQHASRPECVWPDPDQAIQIRSGLVLHSMAHAFFGKMELKRMWEVRSSMILAAHWP